MARYRITGPDGANYDVDAPDDQAVEEAVHQMFSGAPEPPAAPSPAALDPDRMQRDEPGFMERAGRQLNLGTRAVGSGLAHIAAAPLDLANAGANVVLTGADLAAQPFGGRVPFRFGAASDTVRELAGRGAEAAGLPPAQPADGYEKAMGSGIDFATQALTGQAALTPFALAREAQMAQQGARPALLDPLMKQIAEPGVAATAGNAVSGFGSGLMLPISQEAPDSIRNSMWGLGGILLDMAAQATGGLGAGGLVTAARKGPTAVGGSLKKMVVGDNSNLPLDPETGAPVSNRVADMGAKYLQGQAIDPAQAASEIDRQVAAYRGADLPVPTTGLISGDTGLEAVERGQRRSQSTGSMLQDASPDLKSKYSFGERDTALRDAAVDKVNSMRPEGANPEAFPRRAEEIAAAQEGAAQRGVDQAQGQQRGVDLARQGEANNLTALQGQGEGASRNIDQMYRETRNAEIKQSKELYNAPELTSAEVPKEPLREAGAAAGRQASDVAPLDPVVQKYVDRFKELDSSSPTTMGAVNRIKSELEADIAANLDNGAVVQQLKDFKNTAKNYVATLAQGEGSAGEAARAAETNYSERVAPNFRHGVGGELDASLKRNKNIRPSETAQSFLTRPEDAADLQRIAALRGNEARTAADSRTWLFDKLSRTGVVNKGVIDPDKLTKWRNVNNGVLDAVPGLRREVDGMVAAARRGEDLSTRYGADMAAAQNNLKDVQKGVRQGPIGAVMGKSPENAVAAVFSGPNPQQAMRDLKNSVGKNPEALDGMRAAVADHFAGKVSGVAPANVSEGSQNINYASLVKNFNKNEQALAEIFNPEEMNRLRQAQQVLEPLAKRAGQATVGSVTAESHAQGWRTGEVIAKLHFGMLKGGGIIRSLKLAASVLGDGGVGEAQRLLARAMFDPELAGLLLTRPAAEVGTPAWSSQLQKWLRRGQAVRTIDDNAKAGEEADQPAKPTEAPPTNAAQPTPAPAPPPQKRVEFHFHPTTGRISGATIHG